MADEVLGRDQNRVPVVGGVTDDSSKFITALRLDPTTLRLKVTSTTALSNLEYTEGDTDATIVGIAMLGEAGSDTLQPVQLDSNNYVRVADIAAIKTNTEFFRDIDTSLVSYANNQISQIIQTDGTNTKTMDFTRNSNGQITAIATTIA